MYKRLLGYGGRVVAHHLGEEEQWHYLVHVLLEKHAGELSDANRRIHRLCNRSGGSLCRAVVDQVKESEQM